MKTMTQTMQERKRLFLFTLVGYGVIVIFAVLRVLTDISEWRKEHRKTA